VLRRGNDGGHPLMRVIIAGGGNVGTYIAAELAEASHDVLIVEVDPDRVAAAKESGQPVGVTWLEADGCEVTEFGTAKPETADVVVAVTGDDEDNLVISLLAKQEFGVPRVIARINNPSNEWLFNETWGVDVSVSTPHLLTALVEEAVSVGSLVRLLSFEGDRARLSEVKLAPSSPAAGKDIQHLEFPRDSTVVAILREEHIVVPRGDTVLNEGDEVMVLVTAESEDRVRKLLVG
jgi:trk system potassium uptake protein TrkA